MHKKPILSSMISDELLVQLSKKGLIPGPKEEEKAFLKRVSFLQNPCLSSLNAISPFPLNKPIQEMTWVKEQLASAYDAKPSWLLAYDSKKKLLPWHGAMTWIFEIDSISVPLIQVRPKSFFAHPKEMLVHEGVHAIRSAFEEPKYEEMLAYLISSHPMRKVLGPLVEHNWEWLLFFSLFLPALSPFPFLNKIGTLASLSWLSVGLARLFLKRNKLKKALGQIKKSLPDPRYGLAVLIRLTDQEINSFGKMAPSQIIAYIQEEKKTSLRLRSLFASYYSVKS